MSGKGIEGAGERIVPQLLLNQRGQAMDLFTKIDRCPIEVDLRHG